MGNRSNTKHVEGIVPPNYRYTLGLAEERFYREIAENGRFMGTYCSKCDATYLPPRIYCEACFSNLTEWRKVKGKGRVETFTVSHIDGSGKRVSRPFMVALVAFQGVRGGLVHRLEGVKPEDVEIGMPVEPVFKPRPRREGSILDILYFKPSRLSRQND